MIVPDVANPFFTLIVRGVEQVAWRAGYHVILCDTQGDLERERGYLEDMVSFQVEGVLIAPVGDSSKPHLRVLTRNGVPFVLIDRSIPGYDGDLVQGDSIAGARQLVEHLIELGHRRIGMVTEAARGLDRTRPSQGYRDALAAAASHSTRRSSPSRARSTPPSPASRHFSSSTSPIRRRRSSR